MKAWLLALALYVLSPITTTLPATILAVAEDDALCYLKSDYEFVVGISANDHPTVIADAITARTSTQAFLCGGELRAELWIEGYGEAVAAQNYPSTTLTQAYTDRIVDRYGTFYARSKHWWVASNWWNIAGEPTPLKAEDTIEPPPDGGGEEEPEPIRNDTGCPILVDTGRDGYRLTDLARGVRFDLNADGHREQVSWTEPNSDDAWLALDRNGNGTIDDGSELFGNFTSAYRAGGEPTTLNGFEALKFTEGSDYGISRVDGTIDANDAIFPRLLLWKDVNQDGISQPHELTPLASSSLVGISTAYKESRKKDRHGNEFRQRADGFWHVGGRIESTPIFDVWLLLQPRK